MPDAITVKAKHNQTARSVHCPLEQARRRGGIAPPSLSSDSMHFEVKRWDGNRIGPNLSPLKLSVPFFDDFGPFPACPRACTKGALVARTGRLKGLNGRFPEYRA